MPRRKSKPEPLTPGAILVGLVCLAELAFLFWYLGGARPLGG